MNQQQWTDPEAAGQSSWAARRERLVLGQPRVLEDAVRSRQPSEALLVNNYSAGEALGETLGETLALPLPAALRSCRLLMELRAEALRKETRVPRRSLNRAPETAHCRLLVLGVCKTQPRALQTMLPREVPDTKPSERNSDSSLPVQANTLNLVLFEENVNLTKQARNTTKGSKSWTPSPRAFLCSVHPMPL